MLTKLGGVVTVAAMRNALLQDIGTQMAAKRLKYQAALKLLYSEGMSNLKKQAAVQVRQQYIRFIGLLELDEFLRVSNFWALSFACIRAQLVQRCSPQVPPMASYTHSCQWKVINGT